MSKAKNSFEEPLRRNKDKRSTVRGGGPPLIRAVLLSAFGGLLVTGVVAIIENLWLMLGRHLAFGVFREWLLLAESFLLYVIVGAVLGACVGVFGGILRVVFKRHADDGTVFAEGSAAVLSVIAYVGTLAVLFMKVLPDQVDIRAGHVAGIMILCLAPAGGGLLLLRWTFSRIARRAFAGRTRSRMVLTLCAVVLPMVVLTLWHNARMSRTRATVAASVSERQFANAELPNVILITLDTVRASSLQLYGYERPTAPNLTELGETSVLYEHAYSHTSWTLPTHQTLFTGRYPSELSISWGADRLQEDHITLAEILRIVGYRTGGVIGGPYCGSAFGIAQGFDYYEDNLPTASTPFLGRLLNRMVPNLFAQAGKRRAHHVNEFVFRWLEAHSDTPFFLFVNYFDAHAHLDPPYPYRDAFEGAYGPLRSFFTAQGRAEETVTEGKREMSKREQEHWIALYDCEILFLDSQFGELIARLKSLGVYNNSVIIVAGDHGHSYGEHNLAGHGGWVFEECVRVPLLIRYPSGKQGGTVVSKRFGLVNVFPLILSELGIPMPTSLQRPVTATEYEQCILENGRRNPRKKRVFRYAGHDLRAIYDGHYKLVTIDGEPAELYNLEQDPGEVSNLLTIEGEKTEELYGALRGILDRMLAPVVGSSDERELEEELIRQLKAVGYL